MTYEKKALQRILNLTKEDPKTGCLMWQGGIGGGRSKKDGYPSMHYKGGTARATRVMYQLTYGAIPDGLYVCHKCDTPLCVNPDHLFLGTQKHNMQDALRKGRIVVPELKGEDHAHALFSNEQVVKLRKEFQKGRKIQSIIDETGASKSTIKRMLSGKTYFELPLFPRKDKYMNHRKG